MVERMTRGSHRLFDIFAIAFDDLRQNFTSCGIVCRESLAGSGIHPLPVDQHFSGFVDKIRDLRMNLRGNRDTHTSSLDRAEKLA